MRGEIIMILLDMLKTLSVVEWAFWFVVIFFSIKGYIDYPNLLNQKPNNKKTYNNKPSLQQ